MLVLQPVPAEAESLAQALTSAYQSNPALRAERARQRATDELVPQALSGWRPTVTAVGDVVG
ncbi:MAG: TolC family outer membrane protein, partial [Aestuariivirgaceae bacterium]